MRPDSHPVRDRLVDARSAGLVIALVGVLGAPSLGQFSGDPFDAYRNAYSSSSFPNYTNIGPLSGGYRYASPPGLGYMGGGGFSGTSPYVSSLDARMNINAAAGRGVFGLPPSPYDLTGPGTGPAGPGFDRSYQPNARSNAAYLQSLQEREKLYFEAINESDPARRAELLREYRESTSRASARTSGVSRRGAGAVAAQPAPRRPGSAPPISSGPTTARDDSRSVTTYQEMLEWSRLIDRMVAADLEKGDPAPPP